MAGSKADHMVPNQVLGFLNSSGKERGRSFCFQRLAKAFIGADSTILEDAPFAASKRACSIRHPIIFTMPEKVEISRKEGPVLIPSLGKKGINAEYPLWNGIFASEFFPPQVESAYYVLRLFIEVATPEATRTAEADLLQALDLLARAWPFAGGSFMVVDPHEFSTKPAFKSNAEEVEKRLLERQGLKKVEISYTANCVVLAEYIRPPLQTAANIAVALYREPELAKAFEYHQRAWLDYYQHRHQQSSWFSDLYKVREQLKVLHNGDAVGQLSLSSRDWSYFGYTLNNRNSDLRHAGPNSHRMSPVARAEVDKLFFFAMQWLGAHLKSKGLL